MQTGRSAHGNQYAARCPAHDDRRASLSLAKGRDGRVLLNCFAGCTAGDIVHAMGLTWNDLYMGRTYRTSVIDRTYDYTDEEGNLKFQVVRMRPKDFRQRAWNGSGFTWSMDGVQRVLYRLPYVLDALSAGETIYVVEGEKDADALSRRGLCATTNPGGAGRWLDSYTETLEGGRVVILPDNDEAGHAHAALVARSLCHACDVRIVHLPVPEKGDVSDWLRSGGTKEALEDLAAMVLPYRTHRQLLMEAVELLAPMDHARPFLEELRTRALIP